MYEIIKNVIDSGRFELVDILKKIDTIWLQSDISDEQKDELVELAREKANPENSFASLQEQIDNIAAKLSNVEQQQDTNVADIKAIKDKLSENDIEIPDVEPEPGEEYPEYKQPTGSHDSYHKDDKITFEGKKYICIAPDGVACVWSPTDYPAYWQLVEEA